MRSKTHFAAKKEIAELKAKISCNWPNQRNEDEPKSYCHWFEWVEEKSKTHDQFKCEKCGLFHVWTKKLKKRDKLDELLEKAKGTL